MRFWVGVKSDRPPRRTADDLFTAALSAEGLRLDSNFSEQSIFVPQEEHRPRGRGARSKQAKKPDLRDRSFFQKGCLNTRTRGPFEHVA